ncbi:MAG: hypothetical protein AB7F88_19770 [Pyrinomonadaceae bacterium]
MPDPIERPERRPRTLGDARRLIAKVYRANDWDEDEQIRWHAIIGLSEKPLADLNEDAVRKNVAELVAARMLILEK